MSRDAGEGPTEPTASPSVEPRERAPIGLRVQGHYRIVGELGVGAFGLVCLAEDEATGHPVAIRLLPRGLTGAHPAQVLQRLSRSRVAASTAHPGLVRVLEVGELDDGRLFVVMEFVEGRRLSERLSEGRPLDIEAALALALDLGGSVETLHNMGLVHGALRPRNVMMLKDGRVKLMDVELAGLRDAQSGEAPLVAEPPAEYLAPEQIRRGLVTEKTDIYAFAVVLYEMLCGAPPFLAPSREAVLEKHLTETPLPVRRRRPGVPASVEAVVALALEKQPEPRPFMQDVLNRLWSQANGPVTRWKRTTAIVGGAALATSIAVLVAWGWLGPRPPAQRPLAQSPPPAVEPAPVTPSPPSRAPAVETRTALVPEPATPAAPPPALPLPGAAGVESGGAEPLAAAAADAQPRRKTYRVGWLDSGRVSAPYQDIVRQALVGYPQDVAFEYRSADGRADRLQALAAELARLNVDIVFAVGNPAIQAAKQATSTIPIVMIGSDAVTTGTVARPDESSGNLTGVTYSSAGLAPRWLRLLKELRPTLSRVAVLHHADPASRVELANLQRAAAAAGMKIQPYAIQEGETFGSLLAEPPAERAEAIIVPGGLLTSSQLRRIVEVASRARVPTISAHSEFVDAGGLLAYGPSLPAMYRRAGAYIGKILNTRNLRDLPVEQPSRFELVINLKTATALGLTVPEPLILRADRVIR